MPGRPSWTQLPTIRNKKTHSAVSLVAYISSPIDLLSRCYYIILITVIITITAIITITNSTVLLYFFEELSTESLYFISVGYEAKIVIVSIFVIIDSRKMPHG
jgi:hypothetical protein